MNCWRLLAIDHCPVQKDWRYSTLLHVMETKLIYLTEAMQTCIRCAWDTFRWNKKMEKHHNKNKEKMHQRDLLQQTYCGHSLQYILLSWDIIVCLTLWCLPIGIATFRQHTSIIPWLIKETESVSPNEPFSAMIGWYAVETFRSTSEI